MTPRGSKIAGGLLLVVVAIFAGWRMHQGPLHPPAVRVPVGEASPPIPSDVDVTVDAAQPAPTVPERLPSFSLANRAGKPTSIETWRDKSLIINFWATWCAPCRHEIPLLEALHRDWSSRGVEVVGIAVDHPDKVAAYAEELKIPYPLLIGEQDALDVAGSFGFASPVFPFTVFTDRRGDVVTLFVGELHQAQAELILSVVETLNDERVNLPQARRNIAAGLHQLASDHRG
jgi:thiol-disulfide isomerase/thioredoxin